jgi:hypothetical protein
VLKRLAIALSTSTDWWLFEAQERGPDDALKLQFEALRQFDEEDRKTALDVLEGLILKHQAKRMMQRSQSPSAGFRQYVLPVDCRERSFVSKRTAAKADRPRRPSLDRSV